MVERIAERSARAPCYCAQLRWFGFTRAASAMSVVAAIVSCSAPPKEFAPSQRDLTRAQLGDQSLQAVDYPGLHNVVAFQTPRANLGLVSGSAPEGSIGFDSLASLGIGTIISVDGAVPDVAAARARGMRVVHLPIRYDGLTTQQICELTRAVRDLPKPIYLHCHHGKHRSAAAAAVIAVGLGWMTPEQAATRMRVSGTATTYAGLWKCVANAVVLTTAQLDSASSAFPSAQQPETLVASMLELDSALEHIKVIEANDWSVPRTHPDLSLVAEASLLADLVRNARGGVARLSQSEMSEQSFQEIDTLAAEFEAFVHEHDSSSARARRNHEERAELSRRVKLISAACTDCHVRHRNSRVACGALP